MKFLIYTLIFMCSAGSYGAVKIKGKCSARDIKTTINPRNHQFPKIIDKCASSNMGNAQETTQCLRKALPKLSEPCASCFGQMAYCTKESCLWKCISDHTSKTCLSCSESYCAGPVKGKGFNLNTCTGLKAHQRPPSK